VSEGTELVVGAQARAAARVRDAVPQVQDALDALAAAVGTTAAGFRGAAAGALGEALEEWYLAAADLVPCLHTFADNLLAVDLTASDADVRQQEAHQRLAHRLGGGPL
jgi:uncharacterized protein YukE